LNSSEQTIRVRNDQGQEVLVGLQASVSFRRVAPGESDLKNASTTTFDDIVLGDRILARGSAGAQTLAATLIVLMSQSDVANRQVTESSDWDKRGVSGMITATGADTLTAKVRGGSGAQSILIAPASGAKVGYGPFTSQENDDHNPARVAPRTVLNFGVGADNLMHREGPKRITASLRSTT
jgi:hypothetical protein